MCPSLSIYVSLIQKPARRKPSIWTMQPLNKDHKDQKRIKSFTDSPGSEGRMCFIGTAAECAGLSGHKNCT